MGGSSTTTRQIIDLALGKLAKQWMFFGVYSTGSKSDGSSGGSISTTRTAMGAGAGYLFKSGFWVDGQYHLQTTEASPGNKYEGDGMMFDFGYRFELSRFSLGPTAAYRMANYTKLNGQKMAGALKRTNLDIMLTFLFSF